MCECLSFAVMTGTSARQPTAARTATTNGLRIIRAYYGVQRRTVDVTDLLRSRVREGTLSFVVTNGALGGDPAVGADKILIVVYRFEGRETAAAVREGNTLTIP